MTIVTFGFISGQNEKEGYGLGGRGMLDAIFLWAPVRAKTVLRPPC